MANHPDPMNRKSLLKAHHISPDNRCRGIGRDPVGVPIGGLIKPGVTSSSEQSSDFPMDLGFTRDPLEDKYHCQEKITHLVQEMIGWGYQSRRIQRMRCGMLWSEEIPMRQGIGVVQRPFGSFSVSMGSMYYGLR